MSRLHYHFGQDPSCRIHGTIHLRNVAISKYGDDWHSVAHSHNHTELFYIIGGKGQFWIEDHLHTVSSNDLVVISPYVSHTEVSSNAQPLEYIVLGVAGIELSADDSANSQYRILNHCVSEDIFSCFRNIIREMESKNTCYTDICQAYTEILIIRLMRIISLTCPNRPGVNIGNRSCAAVRQYIDLHFKESLSLEQLAEKVHMNKFYLSHAFKKEYGISPMHYLISKRIEESKYLLAETNLPLSHIAQMLGFSSLSYFSQTFRRTQSISPKEFRQHFSK